MTRTTAADNLHSALRRRDAVLATMVEIGKALTSTLQLDEILKIIMDRISSLLTPAEWSLLLVNENSGEMIYEISVSQQNKNLRGKKLEPGKGFAGWVAEHQLPLLVSDVASDGRFADLVETDPIFKKCSALCTPVKIHQRNLGIVELINCEGQAVFSQADLEILKTIADFAAIAIENARVHEEVRHLAVTDELTGLWNAKRFNDMLEYEVERSRRYGGEVSLIFLDLDHFKLVNDCHGHLVGSRVLSEVGGLLGRSIRSVDSAARFGGDEFVLMFPNTTKDWGKVLADRLCRLLQETEFRSDNGELLKVTASFGVASFPEDAPNARSLMAAADKAMYGVKEASRNGVGVAPGRDCNNEG